MSTPHIAVFLCDETNAGLPGGDLGDLCANLLKDQGCKYPPKKYVVYQNSGDETEDSKNLNLVYKDLITGLETKSIKGLLLSGSRSDSFGPELWVKRLDEFLRNVAFQLPNFPIAGICFGHQIISKNLGCRVDRNLPDVGWECGLSTIDVNPEIFTIQDSKFLNILKDEEAGVINEHLNLPEMHGDIVYGLPSQLTMNSKFISIGSSAKCSIQGLVTQSGDLKVLTFQGHPEFSTEVMTFCLKSSFETKRLDEKAYEKGMYNTQILNNQGPLIGKLICQFINSLS